MNNIDMSSIEFVSSENLICVACGEKAFVRFKCSKTPTYFFHCFTHYRDFINHYNLTKQLLKTENELRLRKNELTIFEKIMAIFLCIVIGIVIIGFIAALIYLFDLHHLWMLKSEQEVLKPYTDYTFNFLNKRY